MKTKTADELAAILIGSDGRVQAERVIQREAVAELISRARESEGPPVVVPPDPPDVIEPPVFLSPDEIMAKVAEVCPKYENRDVERKFKAPVWGDYDDERKWKPFWFLDGDELFADTLFQGDPSSTSSGMRSNQFDKRYLYMDGLLLDRCTWKDTRRWAARLHGLREGINVNGCVFRDNREEHGFYGSTCGMNGMKPSTMYEWCLMFSGVLFADCDSQAAQLVQRDQFSSPKPDVDYSHETPDYEADMTPGLPIIFDRVSAFNVSRPTGKRPSFNFSLFGARHKVEMRNMLIDNSMQTASRGFLLCEGYHGTGDPYERELILDMFHFKSASSPQQAMLLPRMGKVTLTNGVIDVPPGSNARIDVDESTDWKIKNVYSGRTPVWVFVGGTKHKKVDEL